MTRMGLCVSRQVRRFNFRGENRRGKGYLLKPQTYMNLSGNSVVKAACFYKILPQNVIVIHDDMDLPAGKMKAKTGGGAGGHNGLKSIDAAISPNYHRIRIGVGHPQSGGEAVVNHVLSRFSKADSVLIDENIDAAVKEHRDFDDRRRQCFFQQNRPVETEKIKTLKNRVLWAKRLLKRD